MTKESIILLLHRVAVPLLSFITALIVSVMSFFIRETLAEAQRWTRDLDARVRVIEISAAEAKGDIFSRTDWERERQSIEARNIVIEARTTRLESSLPYIKEALLRIETKIDK